LGLKLTNSISFGESVISAGFIHKTVKTDLHVRVNNAIPPQNLRGKILEDSRRLSTEEEDQPLPCGAGWPPGPPVSLLASMAVPHRLLDCIYTVP
jgi:hypothetical protein